MRVTYEKWIVLHHKNIQQSTAGQYSHVVIDTHLHIHTNIKETGNRVGSTYFQLSQSTIANRRLGPHSSSYFLDKNSGSTVGNDPASSDHIHRDSSHNY